MTNGEKIALLIAENKDDMVTINDLSVNGNTITLSDDDDIYFIRCNDNGTYDLLLNEYTFNNYLEWGFESKREMQQWYKKQKQVPFDRAEFSPLWDLESSTLEEIKNIINPKKYSINHLPRIENEPDIEEDING